MSRQAPVPERQGASRRYFVSGPGAPGLAAGTFVSGKPPVRFHDPPLCVGKPAASASPLTGNGQNGNSRSARVSRPRRERRPQVSMNQRKTSHLETFGPIWYGVGRPAHSEGYGVGRPAHSTSRFHGSQDSPITTLALLRSGPLNAQEGMWYHL